jgi:hypothetical protein
MHPFQAVCTHQLLVLEEGHDVYATLAASGKALDMR